MTIVGNFAHAIIAIILLKPVHIS